MPSGRDAITGARVAQISMRKVLRGIDRGAVDLRGDSTLCYKRHMRELRDWMREKMRRRPRRGPNDSESTGKSGQELPANQPPPLRPSYPDAEPVRTAESATVTEPVVTEPSAPEVAVEAAVAEPKIVVETQPESLATPPAEQAPLKSP